MYGVDEVLAIVIHYRVETWRAIVFGTVKGYFRFDIR